jgi:Fe-S-cluster containining protein
MDTPSPQIPLRLPEGLNYACTQCGRSCGEFLEIVVDPESAEQLKKIPAERLAGAQSTQSPVVESPWTPGELIMRLEHGHCCLQRADGLCAVHAACGFDAKPLLCGNFPFKHIQTPAGTFVGVSFACTAVTANAGPPVAGQRAQLEAMRLSKASRRSAGESIGLTTTIPLTWEQYELIEEDLAALLDPALGQIGHRLVLQSIYLRLLADFLRQAREQSGAQLAGAEANAGALGVFHERMRERREGGLFSILQRTATRRKTSPMLRRSLLGFTHALRTTYTRRGGRLASYCRVTGQYFSFARGTGSIELPGTGGPVAYEKFSKVKFDPARPEFDELLTRYFKHRLFRKDLLAADTLHGAHHLHLMHWGMIHWYAAALAAAAGCEAIEYDHLAEGLRLVEKHYVFHSSFDRIFSFYPMLRGFMDRIFMNPLYAFSMGWGEWAD